MGTIVIADDHSEIRELLKIMVEEAGHNVIGQAGNGQDALALVREHMPDAILLDLSMPLMDGLQVLQILRKEDGYPGVILILTGFEEESFSVRAHKLGANAYIEKGGGLFTVVDILSKEMK